MADVAIAVVRFTSPATPGNLDVVALSSQLGGLTPKAVMIFGGASGGGSTPDARWSVGFAARHGSPEATNQRVFCSTSLNANTSTNVNSRWRNDKVIQAANGSIFLSASVSAWITNGVRLNFDVALLGGVGREYTAVFFAGNDVEAYVNHVTMSGTGAFSIDVTAPGFQPNVVIFGSAVMNTAVNTNLDQHGIAFGVSDGVNNYCVGQMEPDGVAAGGTPGAVAYNDACGFWFNSSTGVAALKFVADTFDASGFTMNSNATAGGDIWGYLALRLTNGARATIQPYALPTVTGNQSQTIPGSPAFPADAVLMAVASPTGYGSVQFNNAAGASIGVGAFDTIAQGCHNAKIDYNADPTSNTEHTLSNAMALGSQTAIDAALATFVSMDADGWTLNYSAVTGNASVGWALAFETAYVPPPEPARATQAYMLVGITQERPARVTQAYMLVGVKRERPPCLTKEADCWRIERTDGTVYRFTSHNRPVTFNSETYTPCASITPSALQQSAEWGTTENIDLTGLVSPNHISEPDLWAGRLTGASVEIWRVAWDGSTAPVLIASGIAGRLIITDTTYQLEAVTAGHRLTQRPILQPVMPSCRFVLGDARCGVNIAALAVTGAVTSVGAVNVFTNTHRRVFADTSRIEAADHWRLGKLTWTGGPNVGITTDVKSFADGTFVLEMPLEYPIEIGDAYTLTPGCDLLKTTCDSKFSNGVNFGGFPYVIGADQLAYVPPVKE